MGRGLMAMTTCRECSQPVSDQAATCPRCGIAEPGRVQNLHPVPASVSDPAESPEDRRTNAIIVGVIAAVAVLALVIGVASQSGNDDESDDDVASEVAELDPLEQASIAFLASPSSSDVKRAMDAALSATGELATAENYSRAGSTLVALRRENGSDEMRVLECIPAHARDPRLPGVSFSNAAALCSLIVTGAMTP